MAKNTSNCPMSSTAIVDRYFLEHRAKLIDLAAFLDRVDRAEGSSKSEPDFRIAAMRQAINELNTEEPGRARRVQEIFSDQSTEPIDKAPMKGALGAFNPEEAE